MVPRSIDVAGDALTAVNNLSIVYGKFSYGVPTHDPVGVKHYAGDTFLPLLKVPSAIFQVDVTP
jgi:hypothetical protein